MRWVARYAKIRPARSLLTPAVGSGVFKYLQYLLAPIFRVFTFRLWRYYRVNWTFCLPCFGQSVHSSGLCPWSVSLSHGRNVHLLLSTVNSVALFLWFFRSPPFVSSWSCRCQIINKRLSINLPDSAELACLNSTDTDKVSDIVHMVAAHFDCHCGCDPLFSHDQNSTVLPRLCNW